MKIDKISKNSNGIRVILKIENGWVDKDKNYFPSFEEYIIPYSDIPNDLSETSLLNKISSYRDRARGMKKLRGKNI